MRVSRFPPTLPPNPDPLPFPPQEQRAAHAEELRRSVADAEARATALRLAVITEKDKQFAAEKEALEAR